MPSSPTVVAKNNCSRPAARISRTLRFFISTGDPMLFSGQKVTSVVTLAFALALVATAASSATGSTPLPNVSVTFTTTISAPCEYDIDYFPQQIRLELRNRSGTKYPLSLKFKEKTLDPSGAMGYRFEGQASFPAGEYDTRWPDAKFVARIWRFKNGIGGYYPSTPPCARRERKDPLLESMTIGTFPASSFLGFPVGTSTKNFSTSLILPNSLQPPEAVCPDIGCQ